MVGGSVSPIMEAIACMESEVLTWQSLIEACSVLGIATCVLGLGSSGRVHVCLREDCSEEDVESVTYMAMVLHCLLEARFQDSHRNIRLRVGRGTIKRRLSQRYHAMLNDGDLAKAVHISRHRFTSTKLQAAGWQKLQFPVGAWRYRCHDDGNDITATRDSDGNHNKQFKMD